MISYKFNISGKQMGNSKILSTFYIFRIIHRCLSTVPKWFYSLHLLDCYLPLLPERDIRGKVPVKILSKTGSGNSLSSSVESSCSHHGTTPVIPHAPPDSFSWNQSLCSSSPVGGQGPQIPQKRGRSRENKNQMLPSINTLTGLLFLLLYSCVTITSI